MAFHSRAPGECRRLRLGRDPRVWVRRPIDLDDEKLEMAKDFGVAATINGEEVDVLSEVEAITNGGAHVSIDALGSAETATNSIRSLRTRGQHVQVGAPSTDSIPVS